MSSNKRGITYKQMDDRFGVDIDFVCLEWGSVLRGLSGGTEKERLKFGDRGG